MFLSYVSSHWLAKDQGKTEGFSIPMVRLELHSPHLASLQIFTS